MRDKVWLRFSEKIISTIIRIYQRKSNYISNSQDISAHLQLYQRFSKYIDLPTKADNIIGSRPNVFWDSPIFYFKT